MLTDDELRAAFHRIADRAPAPVRVLAHLRGQSRVRRQRRVLLLAGGAAVTAAIAGPAVISGLRRATADRFGGAGRTHDAESAHAAGRAAGPAGQCPGVAGLPPDL